MKKEDLIKFIYIELNDFIDEAACADIVDIKIKIKQDREDLIIKFMSNYREKTICILNAAGAVQEICGLIDGEGYLNIKEAFKLI